MRFQCSESVEKRFKRKSPFTANVAETATSQEQQAHRAAVAASQKQSWVWLCFQKPKCIKGHAANCSKSTTSMKEAEAKDYDLETLSETLTASSSCN